MSSIEDTTFWLLIKGAQLPLSETRPSQVST